MNRPVCAFTLNTNQKGEFFHREKKALLSAWDRSARAVYAMPTRCMKASARAEAAWRLKAANTSQPTSSVQETM